MTYLEYITKIDEMKLDPETEYAAQVVLTTVRYLEEKGYLTKPLDDIFPELLKMFAIISENKN